MRIAKIISIYLSGFLVGIALVVFPAAGSILTDGDFHGFTSTQFGSIFIPQIVLAILTSLSAPKIAEKVGMKTVMLLGLASLFVATTLLGASNWFLEGNIDYWIVMGGTAALGAGFGFTITALNPFAYTLFPGKETSAVTAMHILLGAGTASAALFLNAFVGQGIWYGAPFAVSAIVLLMILFTLPITLKLPHSETEQSSNEKIPFKIWLFALAVFLYGACEATLGNWGALFLEKSGGLSVSDAALGLSVFWGFVALGRIAFTFYALRFSTKWVYIIAPFIVAIVFFTLPQAEGRSLLLAYMAFGGLGMSILFPLSISSATDQFPKYAAIISGVLVAAIQLGTGFSSNVIGYLNERMELSDLIQYSTAYALALGILAFYLSRPQKA